ncbi:MAG TPA: helix-turn-helix domain-containing protein [Actinomyces sp.]|jgi:excisionase family DNA binding protein|nr:helix-turn-helix domain-containing protein [Acidobacteriota bacterium]HHT40525.1 helix-turn-helix domain-containing protein [Actinomyces sp.]
MTPRFLTIADVAEILNLSQSATRALLTSGELPAIQVGGKRTWRIEQAELERYIERQYEITRQRIAEGKS